MPTFLIERTVPGAGSMTPQALGLLAAHSNEVLRQLGPDIQWVESFVTADRITCLYRAPSEALIREHATCGGFPIDSVQQVVGVLDPTIGEGVA
jgi:hypothetical protein